MSTLASPATPLRPNRLRAPRDSHTIEELTTAPSSIVLNGYTFTPAVMTAFSPTKHSSPSTTPSSQRDVATDVARSPDDGAAQPRSFADVDVVVQHHSLEVDVAQDADVRAEHGVLAEPGAGFDSAPRGR